MSETVMTLHPEGKQGVAIDGAKYRTIRDAIVEALEESDTLTFSELTESIRADYEESFDGSIPWYVTTVKLDLEARNIIERIDGRSPQQLRLVTRTS